MADKLTVEQFAQKIKERDPRLASVPDDDLVRKVLERRPELTQYMVTEQPRPKMEPRDFGERVMSKVAEGIHSGGMMPATMAEDARTKFAEAKSKHDVMGMALAPLRSEYDALTGLLSGLWKSSAPGMIGQKPEDIAANAILTMGGELIGGEPVNRVQEAAADTLKKSVETPTRVAMQRIAGAGKEPIWRAAVDREAKLAASKEEYARAQARVARDNQEALCEHAAKMDEARYAHERAVAEAKAKYQQAMDEYTKSSAEKRSEYARKVAEAKKEWLQQSLDARHAEAEATRINARKEVLAKGQQAYAERMLQNIKQTYQTVKSRLDSRWNSLRSTSINRNGKLSILGDDPINSKEIADSISEAKKKYLVGSPESIKQFNDLMSFMSEEGSHVSNEEGGLSSKLKSITWNEGRTHYSALGDRLNSGELPGNVRQAIRLVRESMGKELERVAGNAGVGKKYRSLLGDWSRFEDDWRDMSSVSTRGGSPLARARMAPNAATLLPQVTGKTGDLLIERLAKYSDAGASPSMASAIRKLNKDIRDLPKPPSPRYPGKLEKIAEPKIGAPPDLSEPEFRPPKAPRLKTAEPPRPIPPIDPAAIRKDILTRYAGRPMGFWDTIYPPTAIERLLMSFEPVREWVANQSRKELKP